MQGTVIFVALCAPLVSILTRLLNRMQRSNRDTLDGVVLVSILTRLLSRMQQILAETDITTDKFQSSSGFLAGCNAQFATSRRAISSFQSSSG